MPVELSMSLASGVRVGNDLLYSRDDYIANAKAHPNTCHWKEMLAYGRSNAAGGAVWVHVLVFTRNS